MEKLTMVLILLSSMIISMPMIHGTDGKDTKELEDWFKMVGHKKPKLTKLHFYFHAIPEGNNPNQAQVTQPNNATNVTRATFGVLNIVDYPLTEGPEFSSKLVGRTEGFYASVSKTRVTLFASLNIIFPDGSTITISGHNPVLNKIRELPITGGSGAFRLAQGVVTFKTYLFDSGSGNATVEVNVLVLHY